MKQRTESCRDIAEAEWSEGVAHDFGLVFGAVEDLRAVPAPNVEADVGAEDVPQVALLNLAGVMLGVNHEDAAGRNGNVVDVRATAGDPAIMEDDDALGRKFVQLGPE